MDFWIYVALVIIVWAVVLCIIGFAADRKKGLPIMSYQRRVIVTCDWCRCRKLLVVTSPVSRYPSESRWDLLTVQRLHELGWSAGVEPSVHHRRIPPDVCPDCRVNPAAKPRRRKPHSA